VNPLTRVIVESRNRVIVKSPARVDRRPDGRGPTTLTIARFRDYAITLVLAITLSTDFAITRSYAAAFDPLGYGAAAKGMGGAYTAAATDGSAAYWNPAGLATLRQPQFTSSLEDLFGLGLLRYTTVGYTQPNIGGGTVGFHILRLEPTGEASFLSYAETTFLGAYGRRLWKALDVGGSFRYYQANGDQRASGLGFDLGARYSLRGDRYRLALAWQELNDPRLHYDGGATDVLPSSVRLGGYARLGPVSELTADQTWRHGETSQAAGLANHLFGRMLVLRTGVRRTEGQEDWSLALGGGYHGRRLDVDFAWEQNRELGNSQTLSLGLRFGRP
jgi:hypothetical protein